MTCFDLLMLVLLVEEEMPETWAPALRILVSSGVPSRAYSCRVDRLAEVVMQRNHCILRRLTSAVWTVGAGEARF